MADISEQYAENNACAHIYIWFFKAEDTSQPHKGKGQQIIQQQLHGMQYIRIAEDI